KADRLVTAGDRAVTVVGLPGGEPVGAPVEMSSPVTGLAVAPDGSRVAVSSQDGVAVWDPAAGKGAGELWHQGWRGLGLSPPGRRGLPVDTTCWGGAPGGPRGAAPETRPPGGGGRVRRPPPPGPPPAPKGGPASGRPPCSGSGGRPSPGRPPRCFRRRTTR